jgi:tRNA A37 threonylcarbamoyladenosine dehydratase
MGIPIISSMGAGNKLDPTLFKVADIYETNTCPLAKVIRKELRKRNVGALKVVYSVESPTTQRISSKEEWAEEESHDKKGAAGKNVPGSISFVPSAAGLILAAEVVKDLLARGRKK